MPLINSKLEFYRRAELGLCGNTPRTWNTVREALESGGRWFGVRGMGIGFQGFKTAIPWYALATGQIQFKRGTYVLCESDGIATRNLSHRGLQGELGWVNGEWYLHYSMILGNMRHRLRYHGEHAYGWQVIWLLKGYLDPSSYDEIMDLFETYTDGVNHPAIEFSRVPRPMGRLGRTTVIWEVRNGY